MPAVGWWRGWLNQILAFWTAYVLTRPLGASIVDWLGKDHGQTGFNLGDGVVSARGLVAFAGLVAYVALRRRDIQAVTVPEDS